MNNKKILLAVVVLLIGVVFYLLQSQQQPEKVFGVKEYKELGEPVNLVITNDYTAIEEGVFAWNDNLISVTIPKSVTSIGDAAFSRCGELRDIRIKGDKFIYIDGIVYNSDKSHIISALRKVVKGNITIPNTVTSIGNNAFSMCADLTSINLSNSVTEIGYSAFSGCYSLSSIHLSDSLTSIRSKAFMWCVALTEMTIPTSVTSIGDAAFSSCPRLHNINIEGDDFVNVDGIIYNSKMSYVISALCGGVGGDVIIPETVTSIGAKAFTSCKNITSIALPDSLLSIGDEAFDECEGLTSITIPNSVNVIGDDIFANCLDLDLISISSVCPGETKLRSEYPRKIGYIVPHF